MRNFAARRVAITAVLASAVVVTGGCGTPSTTGAGDVVILAAPAPRETVASVPAPPPVETTTPTPTPTPTPPPAPVVDAEKLAQAARGIEPNTTLGAVVFDRLTGTTPLSVDADRQFRSASLVKLMIAIDALHEGASASDRRNLARMLSVSDDDIASTYWVKGGRPDIIERVVPLLGLTGTEPPELPGKWGEVKLTANDMVRVYQYVMNDLPAADHTLIVDALAQAPEFAADGFDQHFGIPDGLNADWAIKQGWGNNDHAMVLHSTGLVGAKWRYIVVLLTEHPLGSGWRTSANSVTAAAGALEGQLPEL